MQKGDTVFVIGKVVREEAEDEMGFRFLVEFSGGQRAWFSDALSAEKESTVVDAREYWAFRTIAQESYGPWSMAWSQKAERIPRGMEQSRDLICAYEMLAVLEKEKDERGR